MIRSEQDYREALERLEQDGQVIVQLRERMAELDLSKVEIEKAIQPSLSFHAQLREEVDAYERLKRGDLEPLNNLANIGRLLIGARIALGLSQTQMAERLGVVVSSVSRDERNEYHGISVERAQRVLEALGIRIQVTVETPPVAA